MVFQSFLQSQTLLNITKSNGTIIGQIPEYTVNTWEFGWTDVSHSRINKLQSNIESELGFIHHMRSSFTSSVRKTPVHMTIMPMFDYSDVSYGSALGIQVVLLCSNLKSKHIYLWNTDAISFPVKLMTEHSWPFTCILLFEETNMVTSATQSYSQG